MRADRFMTVPASRTNNVWRVRGIGKKGIDIQLPSVIRPTNAAEYEIIEARLRSPNIVNHKKLHG
jgi:hypothetical protein